MTLVVPLEGAHSVALTDTQFLKGSSQTLGSLGDLVEGGLLDTVGVNGEDLLVGVQPLTVANQVANKQRRILHCALHGVPPGL